MGDANEAQRALIRDIMAGRRCEECAEPIQPGRPCESCAAKREFLRQVFPRTHGDA